MWAHPVFGPDREGAAVAAIAELEAARAMLVSLDHCFTARAIERHRMAVQVRVMYSEYGDTFRAH